MGALAAHFDVDYKTMTLPDQKITLFEAYQECMLGNYRKELKVAREARKLYPEIFSVIQREVHALAALGRVSDVRKVIEESLTLPGKSGNPVQPSFLKSDRMV